MAAVNTRVVASRRFGNALVEVALGDVTGQDGFDAVVHPTNAKMALDGKVGAAIRAKADTAALAEACLKLPSLEMCSAALTPVLGLCVPNLIHCRGPRHSEPEASDRLRDAYCNAIELAEESGFESVALPALSAGSKGFTAKLSGRLAMEAVRDLSPAYSNLKRIRFVLADEQSASAFAEALAARPPVSEGRVRIELPNEYSAADFQAMRRGDFGDQDTKWFFYHEEPWLLIYRGNRRYGSGFSFSLCLPDESAGSGRVAEAWAEAWILDQFGWGREGGKERPGVFVSELLDDRFGLRRPAPWKETVSGLRFWVERGKVVFGRCEGETELSPGEAERLGLRLIEMSRGQGRSEGS
jgi:O-acetyl-ADP-ribose deacetylase (regulator of RNase III)